MPALRTRDTIPSSRPLEVTTDAPRPPTLTIISPTPRAFTFSEAHNLTDSPYSSPSHSPFEPDLRSLALSSTTTCTPPPLIRTLSPPISPSSPSPSSSKRRKSSTSSDVERRPKKGDEDYVKRPENAFILFRRKCCEERQAAADEAALSADGPAKKQRQADLSKTISQQWKTLPAEERSYWESLAKEKKKEHEAKFPNYVYRPQRVRDKDGKVRNKKRETGTKKRTGSECDHNTDSEFSITLPMTNRQHGRSASAPSPHLPYQSITIPTVNHAPPSCPTSPSLLPMISRRSSHGGNPEDVMSNFDYCPPSFGHAASFDANLPSSDMLRSIFNLPKPDSLTITPPDNSLLLPAHQIVSPGSSAGTNSSGPSSPRTGPFTPTSGFSAEFSSPLSHLASPLSPDGMSADFHYSTHQQQCGGGEALPPPQAGEFDLEIDMQLQNDLEYMHGGDYAEYQGQAQQQEYAYPTTWESSDAAAFWPAESSILYVDDFNLDAIPPIQLGVPGEGGKYEEQVIVGGMPTQGLTMEGQQQEYDLHQQHQLDGSSQAMLGFDDMMEGHGF